MQISVEYKPAYALGVVHLEAEEAIKAESGAMVSMSPNVEIQTASGGAMKGIKRMLFGGESFFQNTLTAKGAPGEVTLAPSLPGDIVHLPLNGELTIQSTSFLAASPGIEIDTKLKGFKGFFSGEGLFMLKAIGQGELLLSSFGAIHEIEVDGEYVVDTGHIVAFDSSLDFKIGRVGGWAATFFSGEGLICRFHGRGRLWIQSRNPEAFGTLVGGKLPPKEA